MGQLVLTHWQIIPSSASWAPSPLGTLGDVTSECGRRNWHGQPRPSPLLLLGASCPPGAHIHHALFLLSLGFTLSYVLSLINNKSSILAIIC